MISIWVKLDSRDADRRLTAVKDRSTSVLAQALSARAQLMMAASTRIAPWESRTLILSARVLTPEVSGDRVSVTLGYGGAASKYAEVQHDKYPRKRKPGRTWHYLLDPVVEQSRDLSADISDRISRLLGGS